MAEKSLVRRLEKASLDTKLCLLDLCHQTMIHIGGDLSVCDMMTALWQYAIRYDVENPHWDGRDRFVLSKGHAGGVNTEDWEKAKAELGKKYDNMLVMTADVDTSSRIQAFKGAFPDRCYNVGIAEQCLMSTAAGLAHESFKPLTFASMRCYEQVHTDICYTKLPVIIIGNGAGYSNGASGCTCCGLEDSALMVACNNMTVIEPGDSAQMVKVLEAAMELNAPVYIRLDREATTSLYAEDVKYEIGKALIPREGTTGRSSAPASWSTSPWKRRNGSMRRSAGRSGWWICTPSSPSTATRSSPPRRQGAWSPRRTTTSTVDWDSWSVPRSPRRGSPASWPSADARMNSPRSRRRSSSMPATAWTPTGSSRR